MSIKQTLIRFALMVGIGVFVLVPTVSAENCVAEDGTKYSTTILPCNAGGESGVFGLLLLVINIMTAGIGVLGVGGLIYGAILYSSARDSAEQTKKAKEIIFNVALGMVLFALMYSFLNFIIPGGIFR